MVPKRSGIPIAGGILLIIAAIIGGINWLYVAFVGAAVEAMLPGLGGVMVVCSFIGMGLCVIALIAGMMALQRRMWVFTLIGAIIGLFTLGPLLLSSILSLIALILIAISREEFVEEISTGFGPPPAPAQPPWAPPGQPPGQQRPPGYGGY
jgi:hypothetical protein